VPDERPPPDLSLVFSDSAGRPVVFPLPGGRCAVGSAADNDLVIEHPSVVAHQIVLEREGDQLSLLDLFAGETRVNDERRHSGAIAPGDVLRLGEVRLRVMKVAPPRSGRTGRLGSSATRRRASGKTERLPSSSANPRPMAGDEPPTRPDPELPERTRRTTQTLNRTSPPSEESRRARERDARRARALAHARQLADLLMPEDDFELVFEKLANGFLDVFSADRAVTVLFEEDGINPLMVVERRRDGTAEGTGVAQEIVNRCLQVRSVIRVAGGYEGLGGLAAPLLASEGRALGLLYFERMSTPGHALGADDVHLMALLTNLASLKIAPLVS
jgi:hypothetical protein